MSTLVIKSWAQSLWTIKEEADVLNEKLASILKGPFPFLFRVKRLLEAGADKNYKTKIKSEKGEVYFLSLLHIASYRSLVGVVELLLDFRVDTQVFDNAGRSPLHYSIRPGNEKIIELLLNYTITQRDTRGWNVLHYLIDFINIEAAPSLYRTLSFLLKKGADFNMKTGKGRTALDFVNEILKSSYESKVVGCAKICKDILEEAAEEKIMKSQITGVKEYVKENNPNCRDSTKTKEENEKEKIMKLLDLNNPKYITRKYFQRFDAKTVRGQELFHKVASKLNKKHHIIRFNFIADGLMARIAPVVHEKSCELNEWEYMKVKNVPAGDDKKGKWYSVESEDKSIFLYVNDILESEMVSGGKICRVKNFHTYEREFLSHKLDGNTEELEVILSENSSGNSVLEINLEKFKLKNIKIAFQTGKPPIVENPVSDWKYKIDNESSGIQYMSFFIDDCIVLLYPSPDEAFESPKAIIKRKSTSIEA
ncbi:ankyrin repeat domain-containing protein [Candidatus Pacearchaeota archaeon]|nr:ankyrin repeat domain-containing protein [Candidatus Pacearchaeota archaeon]